MFNLLENKQIEKAFYIPSYSEDSGNSRNALSVEEIKMLYQHCQSDLQRALLSVAYGCGLRRSELVALNTRDIHLSKGILIVRDGKGSKRREVPMSDMVAGHIKRYIAEERQAVKKLPFSVKTFKFYPARIQIKPYTEPLFLGC